MNIVTKVIAMALSVIFSMLGNFGINYNRMPENFWSTTVQVADSQYQVVYEYNNFGLSTSSATIKFDGDTFYCKSDIFSFGIGESYYTKDSNGNYYSYTKSGSSWTKKSITQEDYEDKLAAYGFEGYKDRITADKFTFDSNSKTYKSNTDIAMGYYTYKNMEVAFSNFKLVRIKAEMSLTGTVVTGTYTYNTGSITLP